MAKDKSVYPVFLLSLTDLAELNNWTVRTLGFSAPSTAIFVPSAYMKTVALKMKDALDEIMSSLKDRATSDRVPSRQADDFSSTVLEEEGSAMSVNPWQARIRQIVVKIEGLLDVPIALFETGYGQQH